MDIILICGIPNAGKTQYSKRFDNVVHYDGLNMTTRQCYEHIIDLAKNTDRDICIDGMYDEKWRRVELLDAIRDKPCKKICVWMNTPIDTCLERERNYRKRPDSLVKHYAKVFEPPTMDEGWNKILEIQGGDIYGSISENIGNA